VITRLLAAPPKRKTVMPGGTDAAAQDEVDGLVRRAQEGQAAAFAGLYELFYGKMFRYTLFKTGDTAAAEDLTEEVFLRMLESISSFKPRGYPFSSWLFRIVHNLVVDHYRKRDRQKTIPLDSAAGVIESSPQDIDAQLDLKLSIGQVYKAAGELTKLQREVITLRFAGGLSVLETARAMGKNENAVKALQHAAIRKLRSLLVPRSEEMRGPSSTAKGSLV
jgi:RNA polymerase sigma-70 factor (ECF subfamily)